MRSVGRLTSIILVAVVAGLVVSVSAQKGKPAPTYKWAVTFESGEIFGPPGQLSGAGTNVVVQYNQPSAGAYSRFFAMVGPSPDHSKYIGFQGITAEALPAQWVLEPGLSWIFHYPQVYNTDGFALTPDPPAYDNSPGGLLTFLNHKHPSGPYYTWASVDIRGAFKFDDVSVGATLTSTSGVSLNLSVLPSPCGATYSGAAGGFTTDPEGSIGIERLDMDTWQVTAHARAYVYAYGAATVFKKGPKGIVTCSGNDTGQLMVTTPITSVSTWVRSLQ